MARSQKNEVLRRAMCRRLQELTDNHLKMSIRALSDKLGYSNTTVLRRVWKGEVFPDTERLATLATLRTQAQLVPNIHWLITGEGLPVIDPQSKRNSSKKTLIKVVNSLTNSKADSLLNFLAE
jgi:hypothetical protein